MKQRPKAVVGSLPLANINRAVGSSASRVQSAPHFWTFSEACPSFKLREQISIPPGLLSPNREIYTSPIIVSR